MYVDMYVDKRHVDPSLRREDDDKRISLQLAALVYGNTTLTLDLRVWAYRCIFNSIHSTYNNYNYSVKKERERRETHT